MLGQPGPRKRTLQRAMAEIGARGRWPDRPADPPARRRRCSWRRSQHPIWTCAAYGIGAQILADMGVHDMILLSNAHRNVVAIEGYGLNIVGERAIPADGA